MGLLTWLPLHHYAPSYIIIQLLFSLTISSSTPTSPPSVKHHCKFRTDAEKEHLKALEPLIGQTFTATYTTPNPNREYTFYIGICTQPCPSTDARLTSVCKENVGVVQTWKDERGAFQHRVVGRFDNAAIQGSDRWKMMTYFDGDEYHHHCNLNSNRKANLMFTCDETLSAPAVHVLEENSQRNDSCYYLIEVASSALCPKSNSILPRGVSAGSVIVILVVVAVSCYLIFGCLYRRVVVGAKGLDQMPNLPFWQNLGNLMADGCDFLFRTKTPITSSQRSVPGSGGGYQPVTSSPGERVYKGLGDDILSNGDVSANDDSLLPM